MILRHLFSAAAAALVVSFVPASAATVAPGQTYCDSQNQQVDDSSCDLGGGDLGQTASVTLTFEGDGFLKGWIRDQGGTSSNFKDAATIVLERASYVMFEIFDIDPGFAGTISLGPYSELMGVGGVTETGKGYLAAGTYSFVFDATDPDEVVTNTSEYLLTVTAVPLPAAAFLLLGGLGGLAAVSRRRS